MSRVRPTGEPQDREAGGAGPPDDEPGGARHVLRAPNHLGDVVMALPALAADGGDVMVLRRLAPLVEMARLEACVLPLDRGPAGWLRAVATLRRAGYREGTLLTPAFSAAWLFRCGGVARLRGTDTDGRGFLLGERVTPEGLRGRHRTLQYAALLGRAGRGPESGPAAVEPPRLHPPADRIARWRGRLGVGPVVALAPGTNAPARRWPAARFAAVARALAADGAQVVVVGGATERALTARVASGAPGSLDLGGATDLPDLAALLAACDALVANDSGPMHLAGAVGTRTVTLWGSSDPAEVHPPGGRDVQVSGPALPCRPCHRNHCSRRGPGTLLPDARDECMRLVTVPDVLDATRSVLAEAAA